MSEESNLTGYIHAIENQRELFGYIHQANNRLEDKTVSILQASSVVVGLVVAGSFIAFDRLTTTATLALVALAILFVANIILSILALHPARKIAPHRADWDDIFKNFIQIDLVKAYQQSLSNYVDATQTAEDRNHYLARLVQYAGICTLLQIAALIALILA